jgi:hypothetical protein
VLPGGFQVAFNQTITPRRAIKVPIRTNPGKEIRNFLWRFDYSLGFVLNRELFVLNQECSRGAGGVSKAATCTETTGGGLC